MRRRADPLEEPADLIDLALRAPFGVTRTHFAGDEAFIEQHGFPDLDAYRRAHAGLLHHAEHYETRFRNGALALNRHLLALLKNWLIDRALGTDQQYVDHLLLQLDAPPAARPGQT